MAGVKISNLPAATTPLSGTESVPVVQSGVTVKATPANINAVATYTGTGTGAVSRLVSSKLGDFVSVKDFGAVGDGATDDTAAITAAITYCQSLLCNLYFPPGVYKITSTITLSGNPITLIGAPFAVRQQGSTRPSATIRWAGGAAAMFNATSTSWRFIGLAADNFGTATCFMTSAVTQFLHIEDCSFVVGSGASRFSIAVFYGTSNAFGYSKFVRTTCQGASPYFIAINGNGASNGVTSIEIDGGLFESNSLGTLCVFATTDVSVTSLAIHHVTFNQQQNELCIVDTAGTPRSITINNFVFAQNELDTVTSIASDRMFKLTNVYSAAINDNFTAAGGVRTAMATLVNTVVSSFKGNYLKSCAGPFFSADSLSRVYSGANNFVVANTQGVINDAASGSGLIPLTYGTTVTILGQYGLGTGPVVYKIDVTNGTGWTLSLAHPGVGAGGFFVRGQVIAVMVRNVSGGAMGAITLSGGSTYFKLSGAAFPVPANGNSRTVWMVWDGAALVEIARTPADVPN